MSTDTVQAVGSVAAVLTALAALVIAWRQTDIAKGQREIAHGLARLEEARDTPILVATSMEVRGSGELVLSLANAGGGTAYAVWIEAVVAIDEESGTRVAVPIGDHLPFLRTEGTITKRFGSLGLKPESVVAAVGSYRTQSNSGRLDFDFDAENPGLELAASLRDEFGCPHGSQPDGGQRVLRWMKDKGLLD